MSAQRRLASGALGFLGLLGTACGATSAAPSQSGSAGAIRLGGSVKVAYAGSLVGLMVNKIGPAFKAADGITLDGLPGGSTGLVNQIKSGTSAFDVFISAAPSANAGLMGAANGAWESWYADLGSAPLVIGYNPSSHFAKALRTQPWYKVMQEPGFKLGRTDPALDPKGVLVEKLLAEVAASTNDPSLPGAVLGTTENPAQVFPEESLVARLETGQLDAGFFYSNEAKQAGIPTIPTGYPLAASFTVTILAKAPDPAQAAAFVNYLYSPAGRNLLRAGGILPEKPKVSGNASAVPKGVKL
ncbi:MAG: extracellular solute-binding protein [Nitrospiraceae bacterium]|nr:extracellular solute-binding protein [Nitrospiraceae bacterium]MDA8208432.1 extracellular solute-binding protein [Actinomycetota bacterium]